jgi:two-component system cell cycle sensor histidine kinase/response regulator CckA
VPANPTMTAPDVPFVVGRAAIVWILVSGFASVLIAAYVPEPVAHLGLLVFAGLLALLGFTLAFWRLLRRIDLQRGEALAQRLVAGDPDCFFVTDRAGHVLFANDAAVAQFGPCQDRRLVDVFASLLANPAPFLQRLSQAAYLDGTGCEEVVTRRGHFRLSVVAFGAGRRFWRISAPASLRGNLGLLQKPMPLPLLTLAPDDSVIGVNDALHDVIGHRPLQLRDLFDDLPLVTGQRHQVKTRNGTQAVIVAVSEGWAGARDIYLLPDHRSDARRFFNAGWQAIEDLPIPLLKLSSTGQVLGTNRESRRLLQITAIDDLHLADLLDGLGRPIGDWMREAFEGRGGRNPQFLRGRGVNSDLFVQVTLNAAGGTADPHLIAVLNDVTELKTLEAQFVQSQKMQAIGQLAGGVAHDFNNLLTAISGHCDLLLLRHDESDQSYSDLIQIHQNANRAASLVGQLLAFSRKQTLQPEVINLRDTLSDLTHLLNRLVGEKVTLTLDHFPGLMAIRADKRQFEQVLMNLVVNARDAMGGKGDIRIDTQNLHLAQPMIRDRAVVPPGDYVQVRVIDHGHGISPDKLPKIFEPFYTTKRPGEGTGLGLSTAYGIVKQTGGFIFADSELGQGSVFTLLFPGHLAVAAAALPAPRPRADKPVQPADGVVLLVEDEAPVRAFASRALRLRGYQVLEADCAEAALDLLQDTELRVDIFVTDVIMPGMDGPTWVRQALAQRPATPVIFVSGYAEDAFSDGHSHIPHAVFLPKPFSLNALTQLVQDQLTARQLAKRPLLLEPVIG